MDKPEKPMDMSAYSNKYADYSKEEAEKALEMIQLFKNFRAMGVREVTEATLMAALGVHECEIPPESYHTKHFLTEEFLQNEELIVAHLESLLATKQ